MPFGYILREICAQINPARSSFKAKLSFLEFSSAKFVTLKICQLGRELKDSVGFARLKEFISQALL